MSETHNIPPAAAVVLDGTKTEHNTNLADELERTRAELERTRAELRKAQSDCAYAQDENHRLKNIVHPSAPKRSFGFFHE